MIVEYVYAWMGQESVRVNLLCRRKVGDVFPDV